ncbi:MAG: RluA family pseudouridine synthase [Planctomycetes bacterium]|nr:RluA family pseudouridine synthase [Planctomycetota bacterium]
MTKGAPIERKTCVDPGRAGMRLIDYLTERFRYYSRQEWEGRIAEGLVLVDDARSAPDRVLRQGEWIRSVIEIEEPEVDVRHDVLYEDEELLVVSKSGNIPVHATGMWMENTLIGHLRRERGETLYLAHRIDRETSGVVILARRKAPLSWLQRAFRNGWVEKEYLAIARGRIERPRFVVDGALRKLTHEEHPGPKRVIDPAGKPSRTEFEVVRHAGDYTLVRVIPLTGRTHQIRAHLEAAGHPIVGDKLYGTPREIFERYQAEGMTPEVAAVLILPRHALHCARIALDHPIGRRLVFEAPLPSDMEAFLARAEAESGDPEGSGADPSGVDRRA